MREQLEILISVEQVSNLTSTVGTRLSKHFDKGLSMMLKATSLADIRGLSGEDKKRLARKMQLALTRNELKAVSKLWEKDRTIDMDETHSELFRNLQTLLVGEREPYKKPPASLSLKKARELNKLEQRLLITDISDWAPKAHLKTLLKKWDKHNPSLLSVGRTAQANHLVGLVREDVSPKPKPPKA